jgi:hypothetical protein
LNGRVVNEATGLDRQKGHVGLIAQGTDVWFRNLRIAPLNRQARPARRETK